jgi:hypothetical protein
MNYATGERRSLLDNGIDRYRRDITGNTIVQLSRGRASGWMVSPHPNQSGAIAFLVSRYTFKKEENMDHHEAVRKFEHLMLKEADHAQEAVTELEALAPHLPTENSRELAQQQIKAIHKQARDFRDLAQKVKEK